MAPYSDVAAWCEGQNVDLRRGCSTIITPAGNAKVDQNQCELAAAMTRAADAEWVEW